VLRQTLHEATGSAAAAAPTGAGAASRRTAAPSTPSSERLYMSKMIFTGQCDSGLLCISKGAQAVTCRTCRCRTVRCVDATLCSLMHLQAARSESYGKCVAFVGIPTSLVGVSALWMSVFRDDGPLASCWYASSVKAPKCRTTGRRRLEECVTALGCPAGECAHGRTVHVACISRSGPRASAISRTATGLRFAYVSGDHARRQHHSSDIRHPCIRAHSDRIAVPLQLRVCLEAINFERAS
jgi:hypothetical protein